MAPSGIVRQAYANQVDYCTNNGATVTARVMAGIAALLDDPGSGPFMAKIREWQGSALADGLPLRSAGGIHALHLTGAAHALAPIYAGEPADDLAIVRAVVVEHWQALMPWLDGPPQTTKRAARRTSSQQCCGWLGKGYRRAFSVWRSNRAPASI